MKTEKKQTTQSSTIKVLAPSRITFIKGGFINCVYAIVNTGNILEKIPSISRIQFILNSQTKTHVALDCDEQEQRISKMDVFRTQSAKGVFLPQMAGIEGEFYKEATIPSLPGMKPVSLKVKPVSIIGTRDKQKAGKAIERLENRTQRLVTVNSERLKNAIIAGTRDHETGAVIAPVARFMGEAGTLEIKVFLDDGTFAQAIVEVVESEKPTGIMSQYYPGDGHVHTDYSWFMPNFHTPNGPTTLERAKEAVDAGLSWMFLTDYSIQFFSQYSRGGIEHKSNTEDRMTVWNDHVTEAEKVEGIVKESGNFVLVASQEVPTDLDSHNLVWACWDRSDQKWTRPERVRSEQFDAPFLSIYNLLKFLFKGCYLKKAFAHDPPWLDKDIYMSPYEGYDKPPHAYREHDLVWAGGFVHKPFIVAAHPHNSSYPYKGLHLAYNGDRWKSMAVSHVKGSALIGFEIYEETMNPAEKPKDEVLAVWNMFLWDELPRSFETGKFLVAYANSDAHMNSFSGQRKFGKTKTFVRIDQSKELGFESLIEALEKGWCTCSSLGDFTTLTLESEGTIYHPGSFVEIKKGQSLIFSIECTPITKGRTAKAKLVPCVKPPEYQGSSGSTTDPSDYYKDMVTLMTKYSLQIELHKNRAEIKIDPKDLAYPGTCPDISMAIDDNPIACFRAEVEFEGGDEPNGHACTNPIFVRLK